LLIQLKISEFLFWETKVDTPTKYLYKLFRFLGKMAVFLAVVFRHLILIKWGQCTQMYYVNNIYFIFFTGGFVWRSLEGRSQFNLYEFVVRHNFINFMGDGEGELWMLLALVKLEQDLFLSFENMFMFFCV
jgi:hypothetical protein